MMLTVELCLLVKYGHEGCIANHVRGGMHEVSAAYYVRCSCCALMDEAVLWNAECCSARFQMLHGSCSPDAAKCEWCYLAFHSSLLGPSICQGKV